MFCVEFQFEFYRPLGVCIIVSSCFSDATTDAPPHRPNPNIPVHQKCWPK